MHVGVWIIGSSERLWKGKLEAKKNTLSPFSISAFHLPLSLFFICFSLDDLLIVEYLCLYAFLCLLEFLQVQPCIRNHKNKEEKSSKTL